MCVLPPDEARGVQTYLEHDDAAGEFDEAIEGPDVLVRIEARGRQEGLRYAGGAGEGIIEAGHELVRIVVVVLAVHRPADCQVLGCQKVQLATSNRRRTARGRTGSHGES